MGGNQWVKKMGGNCPHLYSNPLVKSQKTLLNVEKSRKEVDFIPCLL